MKLALWLDYNDPGDADPDGCFDEIDTAALISVYRQAVTDCGYDPYAELKALRERAEA